MDTTTQEPQTPPAAPQSPTPKHTPYGALIALIIIVVLIALGAFYMLKHKALAPTGELPEESATLDRLGNQSDSTEAAAIEADLMAETPDEFSAELDAALEGLDAAFEE